MERRREDLDEDDLHQPDRAGDEHGHEASGDVAEEGEGRGGIGAVGVEDEVPGEEDEAEPGAAADALPEAVGEVEDLFLEEEMAFDYEDGEIDEAAGDQPAGEDGHEEDAPTPDLDAAEFVGAEGFDGESGDEEGGGGD